MIVIFPPLPIPELTNVVISLSPDRKMVPEEISIVAVDDVPSTFTLEPLFTVVAQPSREMGQRAASLLLERIKGNAENSVQQIVLPTEMIIRTSSGTGNST